MLLHITKVEEINAKNGKAWVKISGLAVNGEVLETMLPKEEQDLTKLHKASISEDELKEAFGGFEPIQVFFDKRGRVASLDL